MTVDAGSSFFQWVYYILLHYSSEHPLFREAEFGFDRLDDRFVPGLVEPCQAFVT